MPGHLTPKRVLMTTDAVGGVWRYSIDLCAALNAVGVEVLLVVVGPAPSAAKAAEAASLRATRLHVIDEPLDWMATGAADLGRLPARLDALAQANGADLLHLNLPSHAAGLRTERPVAVVSHSCVVTWWADVRNSRLPETWEWQRNLNRQGLRRADVAIAPTEAHAEAMVRAYGDTGRIAVVPNAVTRTRARGLRGKPAFAFAAARWWDGGKNAATLDAAAAMLPLPLRVAGACRGENGYAVGFAHAEALGEMPNERIRRLMAESGLFISPSIYEPFGLAALEAAEAGCALVLADIPSYRELWDGAAVFFDRYSPAALAGAVRGLWLDAGNRVALAAEARDRARQFTPERQLSALLTAYEAAAARLPSAAE